MTTPQASIFVEGARYHLFMEYEVAEALRRVLPAGLHDFAGLPGAPAPRRNPCWRSADSSITIPATSPASSTAPPIRKGTRARRRR